MFFSERKCPQSRITGGKGSLSVGEAICRHVTPVSATLFSDNRRRFEHSEILEMPFLSANRAAENGLSETAYYPPYSRLHPNRK